MVITGDNNNTAEASFCEIGVLKDVGEVVAMIGDGVNDETRIEVGSYRNCNGHCCWKLKTGSGNG